MKTPSRLKLGGLAASCALAAALAVLSGAGQAQVNPASASDAPATAPLPAASAASAAADTKDIVLDRPATPPVRRYTAAAHETATAGALAELALDLMRQQSAADGNAQVNAVVSPLSLASALGMVHAGTAGAGARELAGLLGAGGAGQRIYTVRLPVLLDQLAKPGQAASPFVMANRVWLDSSVAAAVPPAYAAVVKDRFNADAAVLPFAQAAAARKTINTWVSQKTAARIPALMPEGSIKPSTKLVVTNAIHFKSKWAEPFDPALTAPLPFQVMADGAAKAVPTMVSERQVRMGTINNTLVLDLPFAGNDFSLMVAVPPAGHTLNAFESDLEGLDIVSWGAQLKPTLCKLSLPKFSLAPASKSLKTSLQAMGVKTLFDTDADFEPMLGKAAKGVQLDNVYQSATIIIDEQGGEAAAATGAAAVAKSFSVPAPACAVDRPFVFAIVHRASGAPLFVGKIADPSLP